MGRNNIVNTDGSLNYDNLGSMDDDVKINLPLQLADIQINSINMGIKGDGNDETSIFQSIINSPILAKLLIPLGVSVVINSLTISRDNFEILNYGTLIIKGNLSFTGNNSGINNGASGVILGNMKVAQLASDHAIGSTTLTLQDNPFSVNDNVYIRGPILGNLDADKGAVFGSKVTSVNGNSITVDTPTENYVAQQGSYVATYSNWKPTLTFSGTNYIKNGKIEYCPGYAISVSGKLDLKNLIIDKNGLDLMSISGNAVLIGEDCEFGSQYASSCQGISINTPNNVVVSLVRCKFNRSNTDSDIFVWGEGIVKLISTKDCIFDGSFNDFIFRPTNIFPQNKATAILEFNNLSGSNQSVTSVIMDNPLVSSYLAGLLNTNVATLSTSQYNAGSIIIRSPIVTNSGLMSVSNLTVNKFIISNMDMHDCVEEWYGDVLILTYVNWISGVQPLNGLLEIVNSRFENIRCHRFFMANVVFNNCKLGDITRIDGYGCEITRSSLFIGSGGTGVGNQRIVERQKNGIVLTDVSLVIDRTSYDYLPNALDITLTNAVYNALNINKTGWRAKIWNTINTVPYMNFAYEITTIDGSFPTNLNADQYYLPVNTIIKDVKGNTTHTVTYSSKKTLNSVGQDLSGSNQLHLASSTNISMTVGDTIAIPYSGTNTVFVTTVSAIDQTNKIITLSAPLPNTTTDTVVSFYH